MSAEAKILQGLVEGLSAAGAPHPAMQSAAEGEAAAKEISDEEVSLLLSAARVAPSADNAQIWRFITVRDEALRTRLGKAAGGRLEEAFANAPLVIVACAVRFVVTRTRKEQPFAMIDVPIALLHLLLAARELGNPCSWTIEPDEDAVREVLGVPSEARVVAMVAVGPANR